MVAGLILATVTAPAVTWLKGHGVPRWGDLVVELFVETPTKLTARQKELMREFSANCTDHQHPESHGFAGKARRPS